MTAARCARCGARAAGIDATLPARSAQPQLLFLAHPAAAARHRARVPAHEPVRRAGRLPAGVRPHRRPDAARPVPRLHRGPAHPDGAAQPAPLHHAGIRARIPALQPADERTSSGTGCCTSRRCSTTSPRAAAATTRRSARVDARRFCRRHGCRRKTPSWWRVLVEHHLTMSSVAQKQDVADPEVVARFRRQASATSGAWSRSTCSPSPTSAAPARRSGTAGRRSCWRTCSARRAASLRGDGSALDRTAIAAKAGRGAGDCCACTRSPRRSKDALWAKLDTTYFLRHDAQEIAWHTRSLHYRVDTHEPVVRARLSPVGEGLQVMIYAPDRKDAVRAHLQLLRAHAASTSSRPRSTPRATATRWTPSWSWMRQRDRPHYRDMIGSDRERAGRASCSRRRRWTRPRSGRVSRQLRHFPIPPAVDIRPDERGAYHLLNIVARRPARPALRASRACSATTSSTCTPRRSTRWATAPRTCSWCPARRCRTRRRCCSLEQELPGSAADRSYRSRPRVQSWTP